MIYYEPFLNNCKVVSAEFNCLAAIRSRVFTHFKQGEIHLLEKVEEVEVLR